MTYAKKRRRYPTVQIIGKTKQSAHKLFAHNLSHTGNPRYRFSYGRSKKRVTIVKSNDYEGVVLTLMGGRISEKSASNDGESNDYEV